MRTLHSFYGEFGLKVCYHVPAVYAVDEPYIMRVEPGDEALYPGAHDWVEVPPYTGRRPGGHHWDETDFTPDSPKERFIPEPFMSQGVLAPDIVICPREMEYGAAKNWPHWADLTERLKSDRLDVYAAGAPGSSADVPCGRAWDHKRFLDASIEAIRQAKLVISTDAGLAHLAVLCGTPLLMLTHGGLVAPGPVLDENGRAMEPHYWEVYWHRYEEGNHTGSPILEYQKAWTQPAGIIDQVHAILNNKEGV